MIAVLEHLVGSGLVERTGATWRLRYSDTEISLEVPESLRQMIGALIDGLDESEQRVLEVAAIAGVSFAPVISAPAADIDVGLFEACCDTLVARASCLAGTRQLSDGRIVQRYSFVHALYREVLYERQAPARRTMLHRRKAEAT